MVEFVSPGMVRDLKAWILSRRNGHGGFLRDPQALDNFGRAPQNITNAYIVWALVSTGITNLTLEVDQLKV